MVSLLLLESLPKVQNEYWLSVSSSYALFQRIPPDNYTQRLADEQLMRMRSYHICKVNIGTALRVAFDRGLREELAKRPDDYIYKDLLQRPLQAEKEVVKHKMRLLGF